MRYLKNLFIILETAVEMRKNNQNSGLQLIVKDIYSIKLKIESFKNLKVASFGKVLSFKLPLLGLYCS